MFYLSIFCPTILPTLPFLELDFLLRELSLFNGSWSTFFLCLGIVIIYSKLGSDIKLCLFLWVAPDLFWFLEPLCFYLCFAEEWFTVEELPIYIGFNSVGELIPENQGPAPFSELMF